MSHGRVEQLDEPSRIYSVPSNRFVADFIGQCNVLDGVVAVRAGELCTIELDGIGAVQAAANAEAMRAGARGALALRPEKLAINATGTPKAEAENHLSGRVSEFLYLGDVTIYIVELGSGKRIEAMRPNSAPGRARFFEVGDEVDVAWRVDAGHFLVD